MFRVEIFINNIIEDIDLSIINYLESRKTNI